MVVVDVVDVVVPAAAVPVAVAVAAVASAAVTAVVVAAVIVVVADIVLVVVGSDVEAKARRPTCRLYWFLQHILHSKWRKHRCGRCFVHHVEALVPGSLQTSRRNGMCRKHRPRPVFSALGARMCCKNQYKQHAAENIGPASAFGTSGQDVL